MSISFPYLCTYCADTLVACHQFYNNINSRDNVDVLVHAGPAREAAQAAQLGHSLTSFHVRPLDYIAKYTSRPVWPFQRQYTAIRICMPLKGDFSSCTIMSLSWSCDSEYLYLGLLILFLVLYKLLACRKLDRARQYQSWYLWHATLTVAGRLSASIMTSYCKGKQSCPCTLHAS